MWGGMYYLRDVAAVACASRGYGYMAQGSSSTDTLVASPRPGARGTRRRAVARIQRSATSQKVGQECARSRQMGEAQRCYGERVAQGGIPRSTGSMGVGWEGYLSVCPCRRRSITLVKGVNSPWRRHCDSRHLWTGCSWNANISKGTRVKEETVQVMR